MNENEENENEKITEQEVITPNEAEVIETIKNDNGNDAKSSTKKSKEEKEADKEAKRKEKEQKKAAKEQSKLDKIKKEEGDRLARKKQFEEQTGQTETKPRVSSIREAYQRGDITKSEYQHFVLDRVLQSAGKALGVFLTRDPTWIFKKDQWGERNENLLNEMKRLDKARTVATQGKDIDKAEEAIGNQKVFTGDEALAHNDKDYYNDSLKQGNDLKTVSGIQTQIDALKDRKRDLLRKASELASGKVQAGDLSDFIKSIRETVGGLYSEQAYHGHNKSKGTTSGNNSSTTTGNSSTTTENSGEDKTFDTTRDTNRTDASNTSGGGGVSANVKVVDVDGAIKHGAEHSNSVDTHTGTGKNEHSGTSTTTGENSSTSTGSSSGENNQNSDASNFTATYSKLEAEAAGKAFATASQNSRQYKRVVEQLQATIRQEVSDIDIQIKYYQAEQDKITKTTKEERQAAKEQAEADRPNAGEVPYNIETTAEMPRDTND